jgi:salicylate hydroxylase
MKREFEGWDPRVHQLIDAATDTKRWALYDRSPLPTWAAGRVALLGDAAHAMLPFFAQGAAQALEDALLLADCLQGVAPAALPQALQRYDALRRPRASRVQLMSRGRESPQPPGRRPRAAAARRRAGQRQPLARQRLAVRP